MDEKAEGWAVYKLLGRQPGKWVCVGVETDPLDAEFLCEFWSSGNGPPAVIRAVHDISRIDCDSVRFNALGERDYG